MKGFLEEYGLVVFVLILFSVLIKYFAELFAGIRQGETTFI